MATARPSRCARSTTRRAGRRTAASSSSSCAVPTPAHRANSPSRSMTRLRAFVGVVSVGVVSIGVVSVGVMAVGVIAVGVALVAATAATAAADERGYQLLNAEAKKPAPLIVSLHCYSCPADYVPEKLGLAALAKQHGFVVAIPAGRVDHEGAPFWNATDACCDFDGKKPDDVAYVVRVIDELVKKGVADAKRVYLVGYSNGAFLAYRVACDHADKIAAIASIAGAAPTTCKPSAPVAVLDVHADRDSVVPAAGGTLG